MIRRVSMVLAIACITWPLSGLAMNKQTTDYAKQMVTNRIDAVYRLQLEANSTAQRPTYFACFVAPSKSHPTLKKWTPPLEFTQIYLVNYAQNVKGFNGLGILKTTAGYLNSHYFKAYHDSDFAKSVPGFIDAFVLWAGYQMNCTILQQKIDHQGKIVVNYQGHERLLTLAGQGYN